MYFCLPENKMKKIYALILSLNMLFGVAACGKSAGGSGDKGDSGKTVVVVYEADKINYWNTIKSGFESKYSEQGYKISLIPVGGGQVVDKQTTMIAQNNAPDLILGGDVHIMNQYRYLKPLNELIEQDAEEVDFADFIPAITDKLTYNGNIYYLPEFFNVSMLYYNKNIFDTYNANPANETKVEYPRSDWTYEEFYATADKLTIRNGSAISQFGCYSTIGWWGEWLIHVRQAGGKFMENGLVTLNTPEAAAGIQRYYDKMYSANRISNQKGVDDTFGDFSTGMFAMAYGGHMSNWSDFRSVNGLNWDVQLLPSVNGNQKGGELSVSAMGIYAGSKSVTATWELIKYITRKRSLDEWNDYPYAPCRISGKEQILDVPKEERRAPQNMEVVYQSLEEGYCISLPGERYFSYVNTGIVQEYITKILEGEYSVADGLKEATNRANNYIRQNYLS